ncbi:MAG: hemolysin, partial [Alistipes sp.]|nr:hemolysin [Alistipes sp.]
VQKIREVNEHIPPLINAYMNLSPTMKVFDTVSNPDFGGVEETGILVTVPDIYPEKKQRYMRWEGWRRNLRARREAFRLALIDHLDRIKKRKAKRTKQAE